MVPNDYQPPEDFYGFSVAAEKTSMSEYRDGIWQFIDGESLNWQPYKNDPNLYTTTHDVPLGIVLSNVRYPYQFVERINPGEKVLRDSSLRGVVTYYKLDDFKGKLS